MAPVHIGIRHQYDFIVTQLRDIKVIAISFREPAAKGIDHGLDFRIGKYLVHGGFFHVEDFSPDGQDGLILTVPGCFGRASGRISLNNENLAFFRVPALTVGQLAVTVKGELGFGQHVGLGLFLGAAYPGRLFRTANHALKHFHVAVKIQLQLVPCHGKHGFGSVRAGHLGLGLSLEYGVRVLDGHDRRHAVAGIRAREVGIFFF